MADTEWAFPFADNNGDRVYSDSDFAKFFSAWFVNGIFINVGSGLQLVDSVAGGMRITLKSGAANINGRVYYLNTDTDLTVPVASAVQDRTDSIVVKLDLTNRVMGVVYKQGDTSVVRNSNVYELQIATIFVAKNISEITVDMITDMRTNKTACGLASPNDPVDVDQFITQFKALFDKQLTDNGNDFETWFQNLKNELDSNQATNLQNQINTLKDATTANTDNFKNYALLGSNNTFSGDNTFSGKNSFEDVVTVDTINIGGTIFTKIATASVQNAGVAITGGNFDVYRAGNMYYFTTWTTALDGNVSTGQSVIANITYSYVDGYDGNTNPIPFFWEAMASFFNTSDGSKVDIQLRSRDQIQFNFSSARSANSSAYIRIGGKIMIWGY